MTTRMQKTQEAITSIELLIPQLQQQKALLQAANQPADLIQSIDFRLDQAITARRSLIDKLAALREKQLTAEPRKTSSLPFTTKYIYPADCLTPDQKKQYRRQLRNSAKKISLKD